MAIIQTNQNDTMQKEKLTKIKNIFNITALETYCDLRIKKIYDVLNGNSTFKDDELKRLNDGLKKLFKEIL